jgi:nitrogen fixation protein FixH
MGAFAMPMMPHEAGLTPPRPARQPFRVTGRLVLVCFLAFFAVVAGVNATMMTLALRSMPGVDVKSAFESSQTFNREIERARAQAARGWTSTVDLARDGASVSVAIRFADRAGAPVTGLDLAARLAHPSSRQADVALSFVETAPGLYRAEVPGLAAGARDLVLDATRAGERVFATRSRLVVKG